MVDADLNTQFQEITTRASLAQKKIEEASRNQPESNVARTQTKTSVVSDHHEKADIVQDAAPESLQEIRDRWCSHRAKVRKDIRENRAGLDAAQAVQNAGTAESYAREAIDFALDAIDQAEDAVLDAVHARAIANALVSSA